MHNPPPQSPQARESVSATAFAPAFGHALSQGRDAASLALRNAALSLPLNRAVQGVLPCLIQLIRPQNPVLSEGYFQPVFTSFHNPDPRLYAGQIQLQVLADAEEMRLRYFDVHVSSPSGKSAASIGYPVLGTKEEILRALESQLADPSLIVATIRQAAKLLLDADKA